MGLPRIDSVWELAADEDGMTGEFHIAARDSENDLWFGWVFEHEEITGELNPDGRAGAFEITWDEDLNGYRFREKGVSLDGEAAEG